MFKHKKILKGFNFKEIVEKAEKNPEYREIIRNWKIVKYLNKFYWNNRGDQYFANSYKIIDFI